jgi:hypothetical protein
MFCSSTDIVKGSKMACKVVLIGGGSYGWTPTLARDMFLREGLKGSELVLVDIDNTAAQRLRKYCQMMVDKIGCGWKVRVADIEKALPGADYVCISIAVGGLETFATTTYPRSMASITPSATRSDRAAYREFCEMCLSLCSMQSSWRSTARMPGSYT